MKELTVSAVRCELENVLAFVQTELDAFGCDAADKIPICIAVEEIFINISDYAYKVGEGTASVRICVGDEVVIEFEDNGVAYNPLAKQEPDITKPVDEREIGGLGIFMVKHLMDEVVYRHENNKNTLIISKRISLPDCCD